MASLLAGNQAASPVPLGLLASMYNEGLKASVSEISFGREGLILEAGVSIFGLSPTGQQPCARHLASPSSAVPLCLKGLN